MNPEELRREVLQFLDTIRSGAAGPADVRLIISALDRLADARASVTPLFDPTDYPDPPVHNYDRAREQVVQAFPWIGYYGPDGAEVTAESEDVGDAADDLADIVSELEEIVWRFERTSPNDATWAHVDSFDSHWGHHLLAVRRYFQARAVGV